MVPIDLVYKSTGHFLTYFLLFLHNVLIELIQSMRTFYKIGDGSLQVSKFVTKESADSLVTNLSNIDHDDYFKSDRELGLKYNLKTAMVKKIRKAANIPIKEDRILRILRTLPTDTMYVDGILIALKTRTTYNTLYVLMRNNKIPFLRKNKLSPVVNDDT